MPAPPRPTRAEQLAAAGRTIPDLVAPGLRVLFVGINPGLYSGATGHHFARPGNRFWPALHQAGFTDRLLSPWEESVLLSKGYGITNLVARTTATAEDLEHEELVQGGKRLARLVRRIQPRWVAVVGIGAFRIAFARPKAQLGRQDECLAGAGLWTLPNPSGLNANHQLTDLAAAFAELKRASARRPKC